MKTTTRTMLKNEEKTQRGSQPQREQLNVIAEQGQQMPSVERGRGRRKGVGRGSLPVPTLALTLSLAWLSAQ